MICEVLGAGGVTTSPETLARAGAAGRPALSAYVGGGGSSEGRDTFTFYVHAILVRLGMDAAAADALAPEVAATLKRDVGTRRLWSQVMPGVPDALRALRQAGLRLVVVSNSDGTVEQGLSDAGCASTRRGRRLGARRCGKPDPPSSGTHSGRRVRRAHPARRGSLRGRVAGHR